MSPEEFEKALTRKEADLVLSHARDISYSYGEDIAQEALLSAWRFCKGFKGTCKFSTWLYRITRNTGLNYHKSKQYKLPEPMDDQSDVSPYHDDSPAKQLEAERMVFRIQRVLSEIPDSHREVWLSYTTTPILGRELKTITGKNMDISKGMLRRTQVKIETELAR
jgi:RNA polymerase sigma factor (sigma-70 family)